MATIKSQIDTYRGSQGNLLSKLQIDNSLYHIKDPAVEQLANFVDTAIAGVQSQIETGTTWEAVTKTATEKYAGTVTQGTDGSISVTYVNVRDTALTNTAAANKIISELTQDVDGQVSYTVADLVASNVGSTAITESNSSIGITATNVQAAIAELATGVQSAKADAIQAAYDKVDELAGEDWSENAKTVKNIIDELTAEGSTATEAMTTIADKLRDDFTFGEGNNQTTSVKGYIDGMIAGVQSQATGGISDLDAVEADSDADNFINVEVTQVDGLITGVQVVSNDIAKASDLTTLDGEVVKSVNEIQPTDGAITLYAGSIEMSSSDTTTVASALSTLDANKANKAAITTGNVLGFQSVPTYVIADEQLTINTQQTSVYVPVSGQTL